MLFLFKKDFSKKYVQYFEILTMLIKFTVLNFDFCYEKQGTAGTKDAGVFYSGHA